MEKQSTRFINKKRAFLILKAALFLTTLWFLGRELIHRFGSFNWQTADFNLVPASSGGIVVLAALALNLFKYRSLISCFQKPPGLEAILPATWIPPIGKYIPGKVASVVGAVWLLCDAGLSAPVASEVVVLAQGLQVFVGLVIAAPLTLWGPITQVLPYSWLWCGVLIAAGALCMHPSMLTKITNLVLSRIGYPPLKARPRLPDYITPIALILAQWILTGFALWLMAYALVPVRLASVLLFISASALANVSGYLAFFAPAGLGVRELVLIATLEYLIGSTPAAVLAVMMRLAYIVAEALLAAAGFLVRSRSKK